MDARRHTPGPTRWAGTATAAGVAVFALLVGWSAGRYAEGGHSEPAKLAATTLAPALVAARSAHEPRRPLVTRAPTHRLVGKDIGSVEVCGFGTVHVPPDDPDPVQRIPPAVRQSALDAMDATMLASEDAQVRAAALWMGARIRGREVRERIEQMARLAVASQDPYVYAMALEACKGWPAAEGGSCQLLSRAQWVRLDPDNAVPWQALAAEAHERDEPHAEDAALQLAALAHRSDVHAGWLPRLVDKALGPQAAPLQRTLALSASWSAEAVWVASHGKVVAETAQGYDLSCDSVDRMQSRISRR